MSNYFYYLDKVEYPEDQYYRPDEEYPEYPFKALGYADSLNLVYQMIREMLHRLGLDSEHFGSPEWNPLGDYIYPGQTVLIKPNLVKHVNGAVAGRRGMECLTTHPSVLRCMIDYVLIALKGKGKIIVADAPVQGCDFEQLMENGGYRKLLEFYKEAGVKLDIDDLRSVSCAPEGSVNVTKVQNPKYTGKVINIREQSYFYGKNAKKNLRITNYDYRELNRHHSGETQNYCISEACLQADVIINLPKPKAHRKAGYTGALKNFVGVNTSKEYLPHHTKGSKMAGKGDEYYSNELLSKIESNVNDWSDICDKKNWKMVSKLLHFGWKVIRKLGRNYHHEAFSEGSWWGNDTVWKMVLDVNYIVLYADKNGNLQDTIQRRVLNIGDMIYCGEKEGPMEPSPIYVGGILFSDNAVEFDQILTTLMGFKQDKLPILKNAVLNRKLFSGDAKLIKLNSNSEKYHQLLSAIKDDFAFHASAGWTGVIDKY